MNEKLRNELRDLLVGLAREDQSLRAELVASGDLFDGYDLRMAALHRRNAEKLAAIIEQHGWPGKSLAGEEGADAAWLILQHAIGNPDLQRRSLPLLKEGAEAGEVEPFHAAYLEDRIAVLEGRPQRYGTQFDWDASGELSPAPLEDAERVDEHRRAVGLGPLAEKLEEARSRARLEGERPPRDYDRREEEKAAWARSAGWRE